MQWEQFNLAQLRERVFAALSENASYRTGAVLGFPGSFLDRRVFHDAPFLDEAPFLRCLLENPNHIGCHTKTQSETTFSGTQELERDLVRLCAEGILRATPGTTDGYVTSGGTEANIQALWVLRNELRQAHGIRPETLTVLCSADTHYSVVKGCDLLGLTCRFVPVDFETRRVAPSDLAQAASEALSAGARGFVLVLNMGTTMFGSVDDIQQLLPVLEGLQVPVRVHVDGAFGGFIYPFTCEMNTLSFEHEAIHSFTLDAHKMLQAPYGTGIYLARKGLIDHVCTTEATYVHGHDYTLCGSRSGANAVAVWMILRAYGSEGGKEFLAEIIRRTNTLCAGLDALSVRHYRNPHMNVVAIQAASIPRGIAERFHLVPDTHEGNPSWWKIVVMDHVDEGSLESFLDAMR